MQEQRVLRGQQVPDVIQHHALIALIAVDPVGTLFGLAQRFLNKPEETRFERLQPFTIVRRQRCRPDARQRLVDHPGIGRVWRGTVIEKTHLGLVHLPPAGQIFPPAFRGFRQGVKARPGIFPALGIVRGGTQQRVGLTGQTNAHLLVEAG